MAIYRHNIGAKEEINCKLATKIRMKILNAEMRCISARDTSIQTHRCQLSLSGVPNIAGGRPPAGVVTGLFLRRANDYRYHRATTRIPKYVMSPQHAAATTTGPRKTANPPATPRSVTAEAVRTPRRSHSDATGVSRMNSASTPSAPITPTATADSAQSVSSAPARRRYATSTSPQSRANPASRR